MIIYFDILINMFSEDVISIDMYGRPTILIDGKLSYNDFRIKLEKRLDIKIDRITSVVTGILDTSYIKIN